MSQQQITKIRTEALNMLNGAKTAAELEQARIQYLGRKGAVKYLTELIPGLPQEARREFGKSVNDLKQELEKLFNEKQSGIGKNQVPAKHAQAVLDITLPGRAQKIGHCHPITTTIETLVEIFATLGFESRDGPEVEIEHYNFDALNIPKDHPAHDPFDTFYIQEDVLLRSHTSPGQVRVMESRKPPLRVVIPGKVFRPDTIDATHSYMFHQIEGLLVEEKVSFGDLKGVLSLFAERYFGSETHTRFRPSFFPFTEPSAEMDISCIFCKGKGCSTCKTTGWIEILGCGMVHPNVFRAVRYDPDRYRGFAFGIGIERVTMIKYQIPDIRLFTENDLRFLHQF